MALTVDSQEAPAPVVGTNLYVVRGVFSFTTTDTTGALPITLSKVIGGIHLTPFGPDDVYVDAAEAAYVTGGYYSRQSAGTVAIVRDAGTTSGLKVGFMYSGF